MIPLRDLIREWRAQCLTCCRLHGQDATENSGESSAAVSSTAGQLDTGPSGSQTLIRGSKRKIPFIKSKALLTFRIAIPMCDRCLSGGGPALQLTVHSTELTPPSVQLACTHTAWLISTRRGNWKLVNTSADIALQWSNSVQTKTIIMGAFLAASIFVVTNFGMQMMPTFIRDNPNSALLTLSNRFSAIID